MGRNVAFAAAVFLGIAAMAASGGEALVGGPWGELIEPAWSGNLLGNPGFEEGERGWKGVPWKTWVELDQAAARSGERSVRFRDTSSAPWYPIVSQVVKTAPGVHRLRGWTKAAGVTTPRGGARLGLDRIAASQVRGGTSDWTLLEAAGIVTGDSVNVSLQSYLKANGTFWYDDLELRRELPPPVEHFLRYPNFRGMLFDGQPQEVRLWVKAHPSEALAGKAVKVVTTLEAEGRGTVAEAARPFPATAEEWVTRLDVPAGGAFLVSTRVVDGEGKTLFAQVPYRVVRVSAGQRDAMCAWADDRQALHLGGKATFVLGIYNTSQYGGDNAAAWDDAKTWEEHHVAKIAEAPLNLLINYWQGGTPPKALHAYMDALSRHGIHYLQTANNWHESNQWYPKHLPWAKLGQDRFTQEYAKALEHPGLAGFYVADERRLDEMPPYYRQFRLLRETMPDRFTFIAQNRPDELARWRDAADVFSTDPYPLYGAEPKDGYPLSMVADWTRQCRQAIQASRPVFTVIQYFQFTSNSRWPTEADLRNMSYMAIVEGAKGLLYWSFGAKGLSWVKDPQQREEYWARLKRVTKELRELEPVLLAPDSPEALSQEPAAPLRALCKRHAGKLYIIACNESSGKLEAALALSAPVSAIAVPREGRSIEPQDGGRALRDALGPFQARVYEVTPAP